MGLEGGLFQRMDARAGFSRGWMLVHQDDGGCWMKELPKIFEALDGGCWMGDAGWGMLGRMVAEGEWWMEDNG